MLHDELPRRDLRRFDAIEQDLIEFRRAHGQEGSDFHLRTRDRKILVISVDSAAILRFPLAISA